MFSNGEVVGWVRREYNRDRAREAERYRLLKEAGLARRRRGRFFCRALTWFGERLVRWGSYLQERYATLADTSLLGATNHSR
jgi:hypothetical protein